MIDFGVNSRYNDIKSWLNMAMQDDLPVTRHGVKSLLLVDVRYEEVKHYM